MVTLWGFALALSRIWLKAAATFGVLDTRGLRVQEPREDVLHNQNVLEPFGGVQPHLLASVGGHRGEVYQVREPPVVDAVRRDFLPLKSYLGACTCLTLCLATKEFTSPRLTWMPSARSAARSLLAEGPLSSSMTLLISSIF